MFGYPSRRRGGFYHQDPYGGFGSFRPTQSARSGRRQPTHLFGGSSPFEEVYDPYYAARAKQERQEQLEQLRREEQERKERALLRKKKLQQQQQQRRELLKKYTDAAVVIQRAFRKYRSAQQEELENEAALIITDCVRAYPKVKYARNVRESLRQLAAIREGLTKKIAEYHANPFGYRKMLFFVDQMEKTIFQLDDIHHYRNDHIRAVRKQIVREAQAGLAYADVMAKTFRRSLAKVVSFIREETDAKMERELADAAHVIQRVVRAVPRVRRAKAVRRALGAIRKQREALIAARAAYVAAVLQTQEAIESTESLLVGDKGEEDYILEAALGDCRSLVGDTPATDSNKSDKNDSSYRDIVKGSKRSSSKLPSKTAKIPKRKQTRSSHPVRA